MMDDPRTLCVFLSSSEHIHQRYHTLARDLGEQLARRKITLVSGGGSISVMGELARTVRAGGGHTVGVIPRHLLDWEVGDTDADELIVTADMRERKARMDEFSDGFLALPGGLGTLEELFEAWVGRTLGMHRKPVVVLDPWDDFADLKALTQRLIESKMARPQAVADLTWTTTIEEALEVITRAWDRGEGRGAGTGVATAHPDEWLEAD